MKKGTTAADYIHKHLCDICKSSHLEGLAYYGGPEVKCEKCKPSVLHCVEYKNGEENEINATPVCPKCQTEYNADGSLVR